MCLLTGVEIQFLLRCAYRITLHPLSRYRGPFVAKLTNAYGGYHAYLKRSHLATYHNHLKYGSVVRQGPNRLVFNTVTALHGEQATPEYAQKSQV